MKLKSPNVWFILGTVPVLLLDFALGAWLARGMVWLSVLLLLLGAALAVMMVRKYLVLPKPVKNYGDPEPAKDVYKRQSFESGRRGRPGAARRSAVPAGGSGL